MLLSILQGTAQPLRQRSICPKGPQVSVGHRRLEERQGVVQGGFLTRTSAGGGVGWGKEGKYTDESTKEDSRSSGAVCVMAA